MLLIISIILLVLALVSLAVYFYISKNRTGKKMNGYRRFSGAVAILFLLAAAVVFIIFCRANDIKLFGGLDEYDPVASYQGTLAAKGAEEAYTALPDGIYTFNGKVYFKNGSGDMFEIVQEDKVAEDGTLTTAYSAKTAANDVLYIGGGKTLMATITSENELVLDGYLLYSDYETERIEYKNEVIAQNVVYCTLTDNSLLYITADGDMYALGFNENGQLGDTTTKNKSEPTYVLPDMKKCSISETHSMTVDKFGTLCAVGDNSYSQLGNKTAVSTTDPVTIMQGVKDVKVGNFYSVVLAVNGELLTAGSNEKGQLGNGGAAFKAELISIMNGVEKIEINGDTCAALTYSGELYVWGDNTDFKAGVNSEGILTSPVKIKDGVKDFTLTSNGVAVITNERDIEKTDASGTFIKVVSFNAQIPDMYKEDATLVTEPAPDAA